jgi:hypothetical protein
MEICNHCKKRQFNDCNCPNENHGKIDFIEICNHCKKANSMSALYLAVTYLKDLTNTVTNHTILPEEQTISGLLIVFAQSS